MYKIIRFRATNIVGFNSGLQRKTLDIDLSTLIDKDIVVILGDNATGKSTFMSLLHPMHTPSNKKKKFVMAGKEGSILREYIRSDGSMIITKCIYIPSGDKHNSKLFFTMVTPFGDEEELNPSGNVSSYYELVKTHFGISADFINFASYNNTVKGIIPMTDGERKSNIGPLMPNTSRFEMAYNIINEKYREYKLMIRNISQKITKMHDEPSLKSELKRIETIINDNTTSREKLIRGIAKYEEKIKNNLGEITASELYDDYLSKKAEMRSISIKKPQDISLTSMEIKTQISNLSTYLDEIEKQKELLVSRLAITGNSIEDKSSLLSKYDSVKRTDIKPLIRAKDEYNRLIHGLDSYPDLDGLFSKECEEAIYNMDILDHTYLSILETHGDLISKIYSTNRDIDSEISDYTAQLNNTNLKTLELLEHINHIRSAISYLENNMENAKKTLSNKPSDCIISTCSFISDAIQCIGREKELSDMYKELQEYDNLLNKNKKILKDISQYIAALNDVSKFEILISYVFRYGKYLNTNNHKMKKDLSGKTFDPGKILNHLHKLQEKLVERETYLDISNKISEIDRDISYHKMNNDDSIVILIDRERSELEYLISEEKKISKKIQDISVDIKDTENKIEYYSSIYQNMLVYEEKRERINELTAIIDKYESILNCVDDYKKEIRILTKELKERDAHISKLIISRDKFKYELISLQELKHEKDIIDLDFNIVHIMRSIVQPGKGLWKEILDMYMYDIKDIANQLLVNTFNGELYLEDFIIDDTSFIIPYVYKGIIGADVSLASDSQQSTICTAMSLAIISKMVDKYGIMTYDEVDKDLSPSKKEDFVNIMANHSRYIGVTQNFIITHNPEYYEPHEVGYILFPGYKLNKKGKDYVEI